MNKKISLKTLMSSFALVLLTSCLTPKEKMDGSTTGGEFNFDKSRATQTAINLLEAFWKEASAGEAAKPENSPKKKLEPTTAQFIAKNIVDCDKKPQKMVTVVFPDSKDGGSAWVRLYLDSNGEFKNAENLGDTTNSVSETLAKQSQIDCSEEEP